MKIEGGFLVNAPRDLVWRLITNPDDVAPGVPGCEGVETIGPNSYKANVKVVIGPIKTRFNVEVAVVEQRPSTFWKASIRGEEGGNASSLTASSELYVREIADNRTEVKYASEVSIFGRLGKFGLGIMKKRAEALSKEFAGAFGSLAENKTVDGVAPL